MVRLSDSTACMVNNETYLLYCIYLILCIKYKIAIAYLERNDEDDGSSDFICDYNLVTIAVVAVVIVVSILCNIVLVVRVFMLHKKRLRVKVNQK